jgi:dTMP kinase
MTRCAARGGTARFEAKGRDYHELVRAGFLAIARQELDRFAVIDAAASEAAVAAAVWRTVASRLGLAGA